MFKPYRQSEQPSSSRRRGRGPLSADDQHIRDANIAAAILSDEPTVTDYYE